MIKVLFICRANICRSPTAHGVFAALVKKSDLEQDITVCSAGTDAPYPGRVPDQRAQQAALARGYDLSTLNATQLTAELAGECDYLVVMDDRSDSDTSAIIAEQDLAKVSLLLSYTDEEDKQLRDPFFSGGAGIGFVPDPVDSGERAFVSTLKKIERACEGLLMSIRETHGI